MRLARFGGTLLAAVALAAVAPAASRAQLVMDEVVGFHGTLQAIPIGAIEKDPKRQALGDPIVIYDNTATAPVFGVSSPDPNAIWGDRLLMMGSGLLASQRFTIFNPSSSLGPLVSAVVQMDFFDAVSSAFLGTYTTNLDFGPGLQPGYFAIVSILDLEPMLIVLSTDHVLVKQRALSWTGGASRLGVASLNPVEVGSSEPDMFIAASTIGDGVPGFYSFLNGPANPGYMVSIAPPPTSLASRTWGAIKRLYR